MRLGIYGGTFDPVHLGHLVLAEQCREQLALDEVWFVPAGQPPHKRETALTPGRQRLEMLELAIAGHERFRAVNLELDRSGPSYTVDTLAALHAQNPARELFLLIGADSLRDFPTWREPQRIAELARVVAVNRGEQPDPDLTAFRAAYGDRIDLVRMPGLDISATDLRRRAAAGRSLRYLVPRAVEVYIQLHRLYQPAPA